MLANLDGLGDAQVQALLRHALVDLLMEQTEEPVTEAATEEATEAEPWGAGN